MGVTDTVDAMISRCHRCGLGGENSISHPHRMRYITSACLLLCADHSAIGDDVTKWETLI